MVVILSALPTPHNPKLLTHEDTSCFHHLTHSDAAVSRVEVTNDHEYCIDSTVSLIGHLKPNACRQQVTVLVSPYK